MLWFHAASVGEVGVMAPVIEALWHHYPEHRFVLTTFTPTGRAEAKRRWPTGISLLYLPLDTYGATRRFMRRVQPEAGILAETELWPNLIAAASRADVPLALINASLSARSASRYQRWPAAGLAAGMLERLRLIVTVDASHSERFMAAGARPSTVMVAGNLKFDYPEDEGGKDRAVALRRHWQAESRPVWLMASTHEGEEDKLLGVMAALRKRHPSLLCLVAPRHPQRFERVGALMAEAGYSVVRRSRDEAVSEASDVVLVDTLGELNLFYALADVAFVGGSLVTGIGGHNVIEPAAAGCPFATGPHADDWRPIMASMAETGGAVEVQDAVQIMAFTDHCLDGGKARQAAAEALAREAARHRGALRRTLASLYSILPSPRRTWGKS